MTLIHCAMLSEAIYLIENLKLKPIEKNPKIYQNQNIILVVSNIGKINTIKALDYIYKNYTIQKAINIGIAGTNDTTIPIGTLCCTTHKFDDIKNITLKTVDIPQTQQEPNSCLYDMEGQYFYDISSLYIDEKEIFIFKIVSDYLSSDIPSKEFVKQLIKNSIGLLLDKKSIIKL